jgi:hypothetical protein
MRAPIKPTSVYDSTTNARHELFRRLLREEVDVNGAKGVTTKVVSDLFREAAEADEDGRPDEAIRCRGRRERAPVRRPERLRAM